MSENFFRSDWTKIEHSAILFGDPVNRAKGFIPILISDCKIPKMLQQYKYLDWRIPNNKTYIEFVSWLKKALNNKPENETNELTEIEEKLKPNFFKIKCWKFIITLILGLLTLIFGILNYSKSSSKQNNSSKTIENESTDTTKIQNIKTKPLTPIFSKGDTLFKILILRFEDLHRQNGNRVHR